LTNTQLNIKSLSTLKIPKNIFIDLNIWKLVFDKNYVKHNGQQTEMYDEPN
jgi:hypothetical protein